MTATTPALELRDLRKSFGKTEIIRGVNLSVASGERVAIIGPNGAGKSTLFNLISGRFAPTSGDVILNGQRINGLAPTLLDGSFKRHRQSLPGMASSAPAAV